MTDFDYDYDAVLVAPKHTIRSHIIIKESEKEGCVDGIESYEVSTSRSTNPAPLPCSALPPLQPLGVFYVAT